MTDIKLKRGESLPSLDVRKTPKGVEVVGLSWVPVEEPAAVKLCMSKADKARAVGCHNMNEHSSRSHLVVGLRVEGTNVATGAKSRGKLHMIDLAGSERVGKTDATGTRLKEAQAINKSLSALGDVINALAVRGKKKGHVPFRNSKLTFLLENSLGGDSKVGAGE